MRKNIHKKIRNTPDTKTRRTKPQGTKTITKSTTQTKHSLHCDADEFYLTYIYMLICATTNKKNNTGNNNTHHSKFLSHATTHTFSQIIIFDTPDAQNHKTNLLVHQAHHILVILRTVFTNPSDHIILIYYV